MNEERLIEIEIKLTRQEDLVEELNKVVYRQQLRIEQLAEVIAALARRQAEAGVGNGSNILHQTNERPPHY
jgi:SlyX protein